MQKWTKCLISTWSELLFARRDRPKRHVCKEVRDGRSQRKPAWGSLKYRERERGEEWGKTGPNWTPRGLTDAALSCFSNIEAQTSLTVTR